MNYNMKINLSNNFCFFCIGHKFVDAQNIYKIVAGVVAVGLPAASISNCVTAILAILSWVIMHTLYCQIMWFISNAVLHESSWICAFSTMSSAFTFVQNSVKNK